jgi:outer membrane protein assembly factor BamB
VLAGSLVAIGVIVVLVFALQSSPGGLRASSREGRVPIAEAPEVPVVTEPGVELAYPTYLGGPERRSYGKGPVPERLDVIWKVKIGSGLTNRKSDGKAVTWSGTGWTGQPTLVIEQGVPYLLIGGYDHGLRKIDARDGKVVWRYEHNDVIKGTNTVFIDPSRAEGQRTVVVTGARKGLGVNVGDPRIAPLRAVSFASGAELWRLPVPRTDNYSQDVDASPLWLGDRLLAVVESGFAYALDTAKLGPSGEVTSAPAIAVASPKLYADADVSAHKEPGGGSNLVCEGSPAVLGDRIYLATGSGHVYGLNSKTLAIEWDFATGGDFDSTVVVTDDGKLLVGQERDYTPGPGGVFLLDPTKPPAESVVWFQPTENRGIAEWTGGVVGSVAVNDEYDPDRSRPALAAFLSVDGNLYVLARDEIDGDAVGPNGSTRYPKPKLIARTRVGSSISTPIIVDDRIVSAGYDNSVRVLQLAYGAPGVEGSVTTRTRSGAEVGVTVRQIARFEAVGSFESTPLVWEGRIYIGCRDGYFYCLGPK